MSVFCVLGSKEFQQGVMCAWFFGSFFCRLHWDRGLLELKKKTTLVFTAHTAMLSFQFYLAFFTSRFSVLKEADGRRLATMSSSNNQKTCM
jgi:hypothetical protein